jgi:6-phosphogluconate dehydrogenase
MTMQLGLVGLGRRGGNRVRRLLGLAVADRAELWRRGSVLSSWLLALSAIARTEDPGLRRYAAAAEDEGERWTGHTAVEEAVAAEVQSAVLYARFPSREQADFADKIMSDMGNTLGGHLERTP